MRSRSLYLASIAMLLVLGLPGMLWMGFPALAPALAAPLLEARGIEVLMLETERPGLRGITVRTLQLSDTRAGLGLRGDDIRIRWGHPLRGIGDALASVVIGRLEVSYDPPAGRAGAGDERASAATTPAALLASLPTRHLEITAIAASGRIAGQAFEATGTLRASPAEALFSGLLRSDALPAPVALHAEWLSDARIILRLDSSEEHGPFLSVDGTLQPAASGSAFAGRARLDLDPIQRWLDAPAPWPGGLLDLQVVMVLEPEPRLTIAPTSTGRMALEQGEVTATVTLALTEPLSITYSAAGLRFASGTLPMRIAAGRGAWTMQGDVDLAAVEIGDGLDARARLSGRGRVAGPEGSSAFVVDLPLRAGLGPARLQIASSAELRLEDMRQGHSGLAALNIESRTPVDLDIDGLLESAEFDVVVDDPGRLQGSARVRVNPAGDVDADIIEASLPLAGNDLLARLGRALPRSGRVQVEGRIRRHGLGAIDADLQARWQNAGIDLPDIRIRGASGDSRLTYSSAEDGGRLDIASGRTTLERLEWMGAEGPQTNLLFEGIEALVSGNLDIRLGSTVELATLSMHAELQARSIVRGEISAQAVDVDARIRGDAGMPGIAGRLRMASADVGVPVKEISCGFDTADLELWQLEDCSAAVLGGELRMPKGDINVATGSGYLPLAVTGLQLSAVLGLMQDPALDGSGTLDGSLPLRLAAMQPVVEQGWLAARPPGGALAYVTAANVLAGIEQPALRLTLRAVQDLRYQRLESRVDYSEGGVLSLGVNLLGSNPEIEGGRPIQLNLNVTQNLLDLLQSLRLSDDIEQQLQRRLQRVQP